MKTTKDFVLSETEKVKLWFNFSLQVRLNVLYEKSSEAIDSETQIIFSELITGETPSKIHIDIKVKNHRVFTIEYIYNLENDVLIIFSVLEVLN